MHIPKIFKQDDQSQLKEFVNKYPFATLISNSETGLDANHIPLIINQLGEKDFLQGHIAKANPLWKNLKDKSEVLVVFKGPNCYISPEYYQTKKEDGKAVPTWDYMTVHVRGKISFIYEEEWKYELLNALTHKQESERPHPWSISDAPKEYIEKMMRAIVGLEIEISSMVGQWKLSQNQPEKNKPGIIEGLFQEKMSNTQEIAELIKEHSLTE